jgi:hypothetical protein
MSTPDDVKDLFGQITPTFPTILGQPSNDDVKRLRETLTNLLQSIDIAGGTESLSGLIDDAADYQAILHLPMAAYDPSIAAYAGIKTQIAQKNLCHYFPPFLGYGF